MNSRAPWALTYAAIEIALAITAAAVPAHADPRYRIGYGDDFPFQYTDARGKPTGIAVEIIREAARRRNIELEWVKPEHGGLGAILEGQSDMWVLLTDRPERRSQIYISEAYVMNEACFLVLRSSG